MNDRKSNTRKERKMAEKKTRLKPSRKGTRDPKEWARKAREFNERLSSPGQALRRLHRDNPGGSRIQGLNHRGLNRTKC